MIVADEKARFGQPEITLGIIPGGGGTQRLTRAIGKQRAMEYILTGRHFDAEASPWGLVNKVVKTAAQARPEAVELARTIASAPPVATQLAKQAVLIAQEPGIAGGPQRRARGVRRSDGDRGPGRGHAGLPGEARAGLQGPVTVSRDRRPRCRHDGPRHRPGRGAGRLRTRSLRCLPGGARRGAAGLGRRRWPRAPPAGAGAKPSRRGPERPSAAAAEIGELAGCELLIEAAPERRGAEARAVRGSGRRPAARRRFSPPTPPRCGSPRLPPVRARPGAPGRNALLQPAGADEAGRGRRRRARPCEPALAAATAAARAYGPHADPRQGHPRVRRRPARPPLLAGVAAHARRRRWPTPPRSTASYRLGGGFRWGPSS